MIGSRSLSFAPARLVAWASTDAGEFHLAESVESGADGRQKLNSGGTVGDRRGIEPLAGLLQQVDRCRLAGATLLNLARPEERQHELLYLLGTLRLLLSEARLLLGELRLCDAPARARRQSLRSTPR